MMWRVAPVPVSSPHHAEGAPGPSLLGTGGWKHHAAQAPRLEYSRTV